MATSTRDGAGRAPGAGELHDDSQPSVCYPDPRSVKGRFLGLLLQGRSITRLDCWRELGSSSGPHHAYALRRDGWPVHTEMRTVSTSDGRREDIAYYSLPAETIRQAGERGRRFIDVARGGR